MFNTFYLFTNSIFRYILEIKWDSKLDPLYEGPDPSETELYDVFMFRKVVDQECENQEKKIQCQFYKYQLVKEFQNLVDELFPDD